MTDTPHEQLLKKLNSIEHRFDFIESKLNPMYEIFTNVKSFSCITTWILKALILLGAGIGVIYGIIKYLKQ